MAVRTLDLVDQEIRAATNQPKLRLPAVVLSSKHILSDTPDAVKLTICRESYSDYEAAARLINKEYDMALLNFKLDCGQLCIDYHSTIEVLVAEFGLRQQVLLLSEYVSETAMHALFSAADIYIGLYPEDLFPHPATFYEALAHGCAVLATPLKAALAHLPDDAGRLLWKGLPQLLNGVPEIGPTLQRL
ncbi:hypothetical protein CHLNCDRAFT_140179 [Chlorella variabilis]|uniref:Uncharacterized protein n=1 Tax=Chlorella variabilis TaxID=554065 RepID=E1ZRP9_CHLVA|nr:hypothetical protein CHLNCDRAFT_140179 [Chlorella variabilis]EFN51448.1 hypothetical protein CHLNCDRAFT_140179 [Chlorella variabilis]|eukprot:XP_005843550.1 hypothetical protein CHLNCDRAFT_140179 [Chlorella variabilis]